MVPQLNPALGGPELSACQVCPSSRAEAACEDAAPGSLPLGSVSLGVPRSGSGRGLQASHGSCLPGSEENNDHLSLCEYFKAELVKRSLGRCRCTPKKPIMVFGMIYLAPSLGLFTACFIIIGSVVLFFPIFYNSAVFFLFLKFCILKTRSLAQSWFWF